MEKNWLVEVWGEFPVNCCTDLFYTKVEAEKYFKSIRKQLDSTKYIFSKNAIVDKDNLDNCIYLTNIKEEFPD